jgi:hypothetical protein
VFDYENEIEFHFQLELYRAGRSPVNKLKMPRPKAFPKWELGTASASVVYSRDY